MQYTRLGETGLIVSRLALGTMTFGEAQGNLAALVKVDQPTADRLVARAFDAGINYFNSADVYAGGQSEEMLGRAIGTRRNDAVIATKVGGRTGPALTARGLSRRQIIMAAEASLRRLRTDWIDVYLFHIVDDHTPLDETLEAAEQLVRSGKIRYVGFSNWPAWKAAKAVGRQQLKSFEPMRCAEMYYSLLSRDLEHEFLPFAQDAGLNVAIWSPLAGGLLTGRYDLDRLQEADGRMSVYDFLPYDRTQARQVIHMLKNVADRHAGTPAQVAIAWLLARPGVGSVIIGASNERQLDDNLGAAGIALTPEDIEELNAASAIRTPYPGWFTPITIDPAVAQALNPA